MVNVGLVKISEQYLFVCTFWAKILKFNFQCGGLLFHELSYVSSDINWW